MQLAQYSDSALSLIAPICALLAAVITRRIILSLAIGIIVGTLFLVELDITKGGSYLGASVIGLVWSDGAINTWNVYIIGFLLLLGVMTKLMSLSGASSAFAHWASQRIKTRRGASMLTAGLSFLVFVDDYFHSLAVGNLARPITDKAQISRSKLAYLLDSTAAPVCVLMPLSSWGAYIVTIIGGLLATHAITEISPLAAFVSMIPMNFYAVFALVFALAVAYWNINLGAMRKEEQRAQSGELYDHHKGMPAGMVETDNEQVDLNAGPWGLVLPILAMTLACFSLFIITGANALDGDQGFSLMAALENTDVTLSLLLGGVVGLAVCLYFNFKQGQSLGLIANASIRGMQTMKGAILILLFAWTISGVISDLETGKYLASQIGDSIPYQLLPLIVFILSGIMAFSTGTSWGTFGIMLPIAADMAAGTNISMMLPMLAAVLAGSVFGDHCSPISDTTILSSTGAACHHLDHVATQLPYALLIAAISGFSYVVYGYSENVWIGLGFGLAVLLAVVTILVKHPRFAKHTVFNPV
ncbi:Na+/H+ antiporter NhaC family protein [Alginatibacterium sediminis]|uniref:Na+/H+ antiporter NhaC family protein n=1 Tax=Alginatibacterium sediminis TaxID=2164068 RepID=A0A420EG28_9ALTE|nr:Na+/H+ antiporter NhaC family protein [Alginatibacterium sediminis]RKF19662.1 Na+/H+ antiporter NhaC family protein [Alginatibacterium sediminis]